MKHDFEIRNKILIEASMFYLSTFYRPGIGITPARVSVLRQQAIGIMPAEYRYNTSRRSVYVSEYIILNPA